MHALKHIERSGYNLMKVPHINAVLRIFKNYYLVYYTMRMDYFFIILHLKQMFLAHIVILY